MTRLLRNVVVAVILPDHPACRGDRLACNLDAVGSHVGDQTDSLAADVDTLIEPLRDLHGALGGKTAFARRFLLQGGGGEGGPGMTLLGLRLDRGNREVGAFEEGLDRIRLV